MQRCKHISNIKDDGFLSLCKTLIMPVLLLALLNNYSRAQDILLEEDVNADTSEVIKGPNKKKFSHNYYGLAFPVSADSMGSRINYGKSFELTFGRRMKWRLSNNYALGLDASYHLNSYSLRQTANKLLPNDSVHKKERLRLHQLGLGFYNRFNFGKRGNYIGNFIDLGFRFDVPIITVHVTEDKITAGGINNGRKVKTKTNDLRFVEDFNYSAYFRLGLDKFVVTASYRLADLFITDPDLYSQYNNGLKKYPELPLLNVGVEIGMH